MITGQHERTVLGRVLCDPDLLGTSLLALLVDHYDTEFLGWEFETLRQELLEDFGITMPEVNEQKVQALMTVLTSDAFFRDPVVFHHVACALCNEPVDLENFSPTEPDLAAWAAFEAVSIAGREHPPFGEEVRRWLGVMLAEHGIHHKPKTLGFALFPNEDPGKPAEDGGLSTTPLDDPELFAGMYRRSQDEAGELDGFVQQRFNLLMTQLSQLPLKHRDGESWQKLVKKLSRQA